MDHLRYPQIIKAWPSKYYGFSDYLKNIGDYVVTEPLTLEEVLKMNKAAFFWAWHHNKKIRTKRYLASTNPKKFTYVVELLKHSRAREY